MRGHVGRGRVDDRAEVAERQLVDEVAGVVRVERAPAAVLGLHSGQPGQRAVDGGLVARRLRAHPAQRQHHLGGVVGVGVVVVVELERPAAGRRLRPFHLPVARAVDLLAEHPPGGAAQGRVVGGQAGVGQRGHGQHGVPDR